MTIDHKAETRFLLYMLIGLAIIMSVVLPLAGFRLTKEFRVLYTRQVLDDNRSIIQTFVAFAESLWEETNGDEKEWLRRLQQEVEQRTLPGERYLCLVDDFGNVRVAPPDVTGATAEIMGNLIEPYSRRTFDGRHLASMQDLLVDLHNGDGFAGRSRLSESDAEQNLVYYQRFSVGGRAWLAGIHQFEEDIQTDLDRLSNLLRMLGLGLGLVIVMCSYFVVTRLVRWYERVREAQLEQMEKHAQEIEEANKRLREIQESKNRLYARLSHDLRAPLNSVVIACDLLKMGTYGPTTEQQITAMDRVIRNADVLVRLIDQMLQLTKLETSQWRLDVLPFRVERVVDSVVDNLRPLAEEKGIALGASYDRDLPIMHSDSETVYLILQNLVSNAVKFTTEGNVEVRVCPHGESQVEISVRDSGPGIPKEEQERIFDEFVIIKNKDRGHGVGLGLSITRELVQLVGGEIGLESEVGNGSIFTVRLPVRLEVQPASETSPIRL